MLLCQERAKGAETSSPTREGVTRSLRHSKHCHHHMCNHHRPWEHGCQKLHRTNRNITPYTKTGHRRLTCPVTPVRPPSGTSQSGKPPLPQVNSASTTLENLNTIQNKSTQHYHIKNHNPSFLSPPSTVAAVCTFHKTQCRNSPGLLQSYNHHHQEAQGGRCIETSPPVASPQSHTPS